MLKTWIEFLKKRAKGYSIIFFTLYVFSFFYVLAIGNKNMGIDFSVYYSAGKMVLEGLAVEAYDLDLHHRVLEGVLGRPVDFMLGWFYPPVYALIVTPFALLPYVPALILWMTLTLLLLVWAVHKMKISKNAVYIILGFPGIWMNMRWGQNSFLTTALVLLGLHYMDEKPKLSGLFLALLCFKPHFAIILYAMLLFSKHWLVIKWITVYCLTYIGLSLAIMGWEVWLAYFNSQLNAPNILLEDAWLKTSAIQPSLYSFMRLQGVSGNMAMTLALILAGIFTGLGIYWLSKIQDKSLKGILLVVCMLLLTPYFGQYDLVLMGLPLLLYIKYCLENGFEKYDIQWITFLWFLPLINWPIVLLTRIQILPLALMLTFLKVGYKVKKELKRG